MATWEVVREILAQLPGTVEDPPSDRPAIRAFGKLVAFMPATERSRPHHFHGDEVLVIKTELHDRAALIEEDPETFAVTPHYEPYRWVITRLPRLPRDLLRELLIDAWLMAATKRVARDIEQGPPGRVDGAWPPSVTGRSSLDRAQ